MSDPRTASTIFTVVLLAIFVFDLIIRAWILSLVTLTAALIFWSLRHEW